MRTLIVVIFVITTLLVTPIEAGQPLPHGERQVVGTSRPLKVVPDLDQSTSDGAGRLWSHQVQVPDATFLKPHFVDVNLRAGDAIVVRSGSGHVVEVIEGQGPKDMGTFWGLSALGEDLLLELHYRSDYAVPPFRIDQVIVGDVELFGAGGPGLKSICPPEDFDDVICYQDDADKWANVMASVGVMTVGGNPASGLWCSGSNVSPFNYLLTNQHCVENQNACNNAEFVFRYYRTACNTGAPPTADWEGFRCDTQVAVSPFVSCEATASSLDFSLTSVIGDPAATYGYVLPDPIPLTSGEGIYIVQHPAGRPHEITHGSDEDVVVDGYNLRYFDTLDTEGGSSGSPIYREADDKLIGLHHCGTCTTVGVGNRGMLMSDIYPEIEQYLCSPAVDLVGDGSEGLVEVEGNGNAVTEPGETWSFLPRVRNVACDDDGIGVTADVELNAASAVPVTLLDTQVGFGTVAAGAAVPSTAPVRFQVGLSAQCGEEVLIDLTNLTAANGGPFADVRPIMSRQIGEMVTEFLLSEDFADGLTGWTVVDGGTGTGPASTWTTDNPGGHNLSMTAPFAIADSFTLGPGLVMDEQLISPVVDCAGYGQIELRFSHILAYRFSGTPEKADVDLRSTATGGAWVNLARFEGGSTSGLVSLDVTAQAGGQSDVQIRFHYWDATYEYYWAVDDVALIGDNGFVCDQYSPGLLFADGFETASTSRWSWTWP